MRFQDTSPKLDKFRSRTIARNILESIAVKFSKIGRSVTIMHICGTHEATVARSGIRSLLPEGLRIISGPGCPVCICPSSHISTAIALARDGAIVVTFGDMFKVPDAHLVTLAKAKSEGLDIRVVYSVSDAVEIARNNINQNIIWLGVGFETTAPMTAHVLLDNPPDNFYVISDFRLVPPAMHILLSDPDHNLDGFMLPGHVSTIIGTKPYEEFPELYSIPSVVGGFDALDFLVAIDRILDQILEGKAEVNNAYPRVVTSEGNIKAKQMLSDVFDIVDATWRGIGIIPESGYELKDQFSSHNAKLLLKEPIPDDVHLAKGCLCGSVVLGKVDPITCPHFMKRCTPETAIGPCMVSDEGTCRIRATYGEFH
ncbi:MAG: hydrogenase formation protein HypD [Candidatus Heimdallarchaeota archaeon]|nr:hydrogenase formation protein HypD [Candidatus Heimdallarchaeota archaeon]